MNTYVALFRGINVGGNCALPMKELVATLEEIGARKVKTYIQSGNAVFESVEKNLARLSKQLSAEIMKRRGFEPHVHILTFEALEKATAENPFPEAVADPSSLHLGFLASRPKSPDLNKLSSLRKESERFHLTESVFYLHAPEGVGRSKLAASSEKLLGVPMTDRNWRTVCKVMEMAGTWPSALAELVVRAHESMKPRQLVEAWVAAFNRANAEALTNFYTDNATNHQVAETPVVGREAIRQMFASGFAMVDMVCIVDHIFEDGEWAILEWRDPLGLRGCGFFHVVDGMIVFQRGYWDKLSFLRSHGLPLPEAP